MHRISRLYSVWIIPVLLEEKHMQNDHQGIGNVSQRTGSASRLHNSENSLSDFARIIKWDE